MPEDTPTDHRPWHDRWLPEVLFVLAAAVVLAIRSPLNTDSGWYLVATRRLLAGDRLYVDLFDVNPPLIFWVLSLPAWLGARLRIADSMIAGGMVAVTLIASTLASLAVFRLTPPLSRALRSGILIGFIVTSTAVSLGQVAQRDQLAGILLLPYALLAATLTSGSRRPLWLALLCGAMAAIGIAFKPFFLAAWLAIEAIAFLVTRRVWTVLRAESLVAAGFQAVYVALILLLTPGYVTHVVPLARETYWAYGTTWLTLVSATAFLVPFAVGVLALSAPWLLRRRGATTLAETLGAVTVGFLAAYVAQGKNFGYHLIPAQMFATAALVAALQHVVTALRDARSLPGLRRAAAAAALLGCGVIAVWSAVGGWQRLRDVVRLTSNPYQEAVDYLANEVTSIAQGEPVYMLSTSVWPAFPVVNLADARWPYHYNCFWPIPALYQGRGGREPNYKAPDKQKAVEREFFQTVVDDLVRTPPKVLIVDRRKQMQAMRGRQFDYVLYLSGSPEFEALFKRYSLTARVAEWDVYERQF